MPVNRSYGYRDCGEVNERRQRHNKQAPEAHEAVKGVSPPLNSSAVLCYVLNLSNCERRVYMSCLHNGEGWFAMLFLITVP